MSTKRNRGLIIGAGLFASVSASEAMTEWLASHLAYQSPLGPALTHIVGVPVYVPWSVVVWWLKFRYCAPALFQDVAIAIPVTWSPVFIGLLICALGDDDDTVSTIYGSSRWATSKDVRRAGLLAPSGVFLGLFGRRYLRHDGPAHILVFAPTRSGKGVGLVIPTLLSWPGSVVVHDIKGENWALTAGWRSRFSHCLRLDPSDPASACYNPLLEVRRGIREVADAQNIADILVDPEGVLTRRNHWEQASHTLLVGAILHTLYAEPDKTLARVAQLLSDPDRPFTETLERMLRAHHLGHAESAHTHPVVAAAARDLLNKSEAERSGILSTAIGFLSLYRDPIVAALTARSDWRIADLKNADAAVSLYLVIPPSDISRTRALVRLILNQIGRRLTEELPAGHPHDRDLLLMLDEFPALGRLDFFETSLAFLGGYGVRAFLVAQSLNQIVKAYGENSSILDNCHIRVAFSTNDERTAKRLSDALGAATRQRSMRSYAGSRTAAWLPHVTQSRQDIARPLLTPGEIMQLPADTALLMVSGHPPVEARKLRYFEDRRFAVRVLPPPLRTPGIWPDRPVMRSHDWALQPGLEAAQRASGAQAGKRRGAPLDQASTMLGLEDEDVPAMPPSGASGHIATSSATRDRTVATRDGGTHAR